MFRLSVAVISLLACACTGGSLEPPPTQAELERYADQGCTGRLRCVGYSDIAGRHRDECYFSCNGGCPERWVCAREVADGPSNTWFPPTGH